MDDTLVTIQVYNLPIDAEMARSELEAYGVEAILLDENIAINPILSLITAGIRLQVRQADLARAREILGLTPELGPPAEDETPGPTKGLHCQRCGSQEIAPLANDRPIIWIYVALFIALGQVGPILTGRGGVLTLLGKFATVLSLVILMVLAFYVFSPRIFGFRRCVCRICGYRWIDR